MNFLLRQYIIHFFAAVKQQILTNFKQLNRCFTLVLTAYPSSNTLQQLRVCFDADL